MARARASRLDFMDDPRLPLEDDARTLLAVAERLQQSAGDRASAPFVPAALDCIEQSLHALSRGCQGAADSFIPPGRREESISRRYARAAANWPRTAGGGGPSHERQAQTLASLHDAGAALRAAAECCTRARDVLTATIEALAARADRDHRSATLTTA
jgi:hypothetical protein